MTSGKCRVTFHGPRSGQTGAEMGGEAGEEPQVMVEDSETGDPHTPGHLDRYQKKGVAGGAFRICMKKKEIGSAQNVQWCALEGFGKTEAG